MRIAELYETWVTESTEGGQWPPYTNPKLLKLGLVREFPGEDIMGSDRTMRPLSLNNL